MRLNSYFSWNSATLPCSRSLEKLSVSTSFSSSATRPTMRVRLITSSPTVFIMRSSRANAIRTDLTAEAPPWACFADFFVTPPTRDATTISFACCASVGSEASADVPASSGSRGANSAMRPSRESTPVRISISSDHCRWSVFFKTSTDSRHRSTTAGDGSISPSRKRPIKSSTRCAIPPSLFSPT